MYNVPDADGHGLMSRSARSGGSSRHFTTTSFLSFLACFGGKSLHVEYCTMTWNQQAIQASTWSPQVEYIDEEVRGAGRADCVALSLQQTFRHLHVNDNNSIIIYY